MNHNPLTFIFAATLGAGAMFSVQPPLPPACEPVELLRFVGPQPEIHVVETPAFGRPTVEWLSQFEEPAAAPAPDEEPVRYRRRRHARW